MSSIKEMIEETDAYKRLIRRYSDERNELYSKIYDAVKESLEGGITPNYIFITPMTFPFTPPSMVSGMKVWIVPKLPEDKEVVTLYIKEDE